MDAQEGCRQTQNWKKENKIPSAFNSCQSSEDTRLRCPPTRNGRRFPMMSSDQERSRSLYHRTSVGETWLRARPRGCKLTRVSLASRPSLFHAERRALEAGLDFEGVVCVMCLWPGLVFGRVHVCLSTCASTSVLRSA